MADSLTAALTAVLGVGVFVAGQSIQRFVLDPIQEQRRTIGDVAHAVLMFGNVNNVAEIRAKGLAVAWAGEPEQVVREVRALAARLQASLYVIPLYGVFAKLHVVRSRERILIAIKHLTGWSNSIYSGGAQAAQDAVVAALGIVRND
jgi:hypothetical protein